MARGKWKEAYSLLQCVLWRTPHHRRALEIQYSSLILFKIHFARVQLFRSHLCVEHRYCRALLDLLLARPVRALESINCALNHSGAHSTVTSSRLVEVQRRRRHRDRSRIGLPAVIRAEVTALQESISRCSDPSLQQSFINQVFNSGSLFGSTIPKGGFNIISFSKWIHVIIF